MFRSKFSLAAFVSANLLLFALACAAQQQPAPTPTAEAFAVELLAAETAEAETALLAARQDSINASLGKSLVEIGEQAVKESEFKRAERAFNLALKIGEKINDKSIAAAALRNLGTAKRRQGAFSVALDFFTRALTIDEALENETGIALDSDGIGIAQTSLGNYETAIKAFRRMLEINERLGNKGGAAGAYSSLNIVYQYLGDFESALANGQKALAIARAADNKPFVGMALSNLSLVYDSRGDFRAALEARQEALSLFEAAGNKPRIALTLNNIGGTYLAQGDLPVAETYFTRSLAIREQIGDKDGIARAVLRLGEVKSRLNDYAAALEFFNRSLALREESADPSALAETLNAVGEVYFKQGDAPKASENFKRALQIAEGINERETIARTLVSLAKVSMAQNQIEAARTHAARAVALATEMSLREILWEAQTLAGEIALADGDKTRARQNFEAAIKTVEDARLLIAGGERERQQFFESKIKPYHALVEVLINDKKYEEAFACAERAKARVLLDVLQTGRAELNKAMTAPEKAQETKLRNQVFAVNNKLQAEAAKEKPDQTQLADLQTELARARGALDSFTTLLYVAHPELKLQRGANEIVGTTQLDELLPDTNTALLEFVVAERRAFLFVVTKDKTKPSLQVFTIEAGREALKKSVENFREKLARRDLRFGEDARKIYNQLFPAAAAKAIETKTRLVVSPDAALWELPFQALTDNQNKYLVERSAISYAPSLSVLAEIERKQTARAAESNLLAFGNPTLKTAKVSAQEKPEKPVLMGETLADLPEAERQVKALSALYGARRSQAFVGAQATETEFKKSAANYKILHLATHGILDDASPLYSYVLLAGDASGAEDGRLEARELMQMNLSANLVVLSACETGRGRVGAGEGLVGLSWAFFVAGSPTTVASQWKVESASTTELMLGFYRGLQANQKAVSKAEALRQSALALLKNERYAHPFYWAGFVIVGDGN